MRVEVDIFSPEQDYEARGVVARVMPIGHYEEGVLLRKPIYRYLTLDCGPGRDSYAVEFVRQATVTVTAKGSFLDPREIKKGEIVVSPGFIYRKIPWSSPLMTAHLKALKNYKRKDIVKADVDKTAPAIDLGKIDPHNTTKH